MDPGREKATTAERHMSAADMSSVLMPARRMSGERALNCGRMQKRDSVRGARMSTSMVRCCWSNGQRSKSVRKNALP